MTNKLKPLFVANWKMNLDKKQTQSLVSEIKKQCRVNPQIETVVCPSYTNIPLTAEGLHRTDIKIGAQDVSWQESGSMTGEVSATMLKDFGVEYVIVGHSERRGCLEETNKMINSKLVTCFKNGLKPILCVGETFEERQSGRKDSVIAAQVREALTGIVLGRQHQITIAYEPVWVIGSGQAVDPDEARHIASVIRAEIFDIYHSHEKNIEEYLRILYGGSVNSQNIKNFVSDEISGVLVGSASLQADEFCRMLDQLTDL